jgi:hypothetical protein
MNDLDITGFVIFPDESSGVKISDVGRTMVYLVAIGNGTEFSNTTTKIKGHFSGDDITLRVSKSNDILESLKIIDRNLLVKNEKTIRLISSVLIGWSKFSYHQKWNGEDWICNFRDLTTEGKKLYYSLRKLHNEDDIRILTFNNIK